VEKWQGLWLWIPDSRLRGFRNDQRMTKRRC
jgi:hypothetical protein